ncbi:MAG: response regulator [Myxococcales bacterium]
MLGWQRSEVVGRLGCDRFFPAGAPDASPQCEPPATRGEVEMVRKDGTRFPAHVITYRLPDGQGGTGFLAVCFDLSERKALEAELLQSQKMESIGRLAGGVAHDFNNMVQAILGYTELALESAGPGQLREDLHEIRQAARRSAELTAQLLAFARKQATTPRALVLNDLVSQLRKLAERLLGEHLELVFKPAADLWTISIDPTQVDQVLVNLLVNARDAMGVSGTIVVRTFNQTVDAAFCAARPDAAPGDYAVLEVADTGHGMDEPTVRRIFEPFFTTKGPGKGTGLGLATVYGVVKQNGGFITVDSRPGEGTTFRLFFPRHHGEATAARPALDAPGPTRGSETVLVVEDERQLLELARRTLEGQGYQVLAAGTPKVALQSLAGHPGPVHLLLTDVVMPEMSGPDLWEQLRASHPDLRCVFMSGYSDEALRARLRAEQGIPFLQKPFEVGDLAAVIRRALDAPPPGAGPAPRPQQT